MTFAKQLLTAGAAAALFSGAASAQVPIDYTNHWQPMMLDQTSGFVGMSDTFLFTPVGFAPDTAGVGDSIRRCFGTDTTQGGRNQSAGAIETTWFRMVQGYGPGAATQAAQTGIVSVQGATESDNGGDACFSPWFASATNTGGHNVHAAIIFGNFGAAGQPIPTYWIVVAQWAGTTTTNFHGTAGNPTIGTQAAGPFAGVNPLLTNVIFEVQGPLNGNDHQYYLATTSELAAGDGGVTNGNAGWGSSLFGVPAATSGAMSHTRIFAFDPGSGTLAAYTLGLGGKAGDTELTEYLAFHSPGLWGINNGQEGQGGNDWNLSTDPVSTVDLRMQDNLAGAQTNGLPTAVFDPCIVFNQPLFVYSCTPAVGMVKELPMSWDDLAGIVPAQPGSIIIGPQATAREGAQTVPANFDTCTSLALGNSGITLGTPFTPAQDFFTDGAFNGIFFEGLTGPVVSGTSNFSGGPTQLVASGKPGLAGAKLGIAGLGVQVNACTGAIGVTEVANSLEINIQ